MKFIPIFIAVVVATLSITGCFAPSTKMKEAAEINTQMGIEYFKQGDLKQALQKLNRAIEEDPTLASAYSSLALLDQRLEKSKETEKNFLKAIKLDSDNPETQNNYGVFLYQQGRYQEAERHFLNAVKNPFYSTPALAYENAGVATQRLGDYKKAESHYLNALQIQKNLPVSLYHMAEIKFQLKQYNEAQEYLQRYQKISNNTAQSLWLGINIEKSLHNEGMAAQYASFLKQNFPDSVENQMAQKSIELP
ncbi:type IV pilus biogenesis/stability protein PilW [Candidatus Nitrosacidococcus sp. I8]|uniref:type IV pilus biogenesis/stability protein PilW n=1 Tax=Candidatus Nitrosacidococcus sp. I8 TaxID=2942908 RepID=UPI0022262BF7|nr:type IV pilus biogenesis/stability protein PilW [Candidatus Nitrosacidococcus sp. I8]CAH9018830.1 hypothetical protein NURINAE_01163 [Candidatus Nitrosacidococcus sp. I8]